MRIENSTPVSRFSPVISRATTNPLGLDALQGSLIGQATSSSFLVAMTAASSAFSLGKTIGTGLYSAFFRGASLKALSFMTGFTSEVLAFRAANQILISGSESCFHLPGLLSTAGDFLMLKGAGVLMGRSSFLLKQGVQALAMVGGEYGREAFHLQEISQKSFAERYVNALATGFAMEVGASGLRIATGSRLENIQRQLERSTAYHSTNVDSIVAENPLVFNAERPNETSTDRIVHAINQNDGCPFKREVGEAHSARPREELTPAEVKGEYYDLLLEDLPGIVGISRKFRLSFPLGLVAYAHPDSPELVSVYERGFHKRLHAAIAERGFEGASYELHNAAARTLDIATEEWLRRIDPTAPHFTRLNELTCPMRQAKFGLVAAQKRISSAMIQTVHISASFQRFIVSIFMRKHGRRPSQQEMDTIYMRSSATAVRLTEFHLLRTRPVREVLGSESFGDGIVHLYTDDSHFDIIDDRIELVSEAFVEQMASMPVDTSDGRIGCPGKKHISDIWFWLQEISQEHSFHLL